MPSVYQVPPPRRGGTRIYCPLVDVNATEQSDTLQMCGWHPRRDTAATRSRYRRHFRRDHIVPFVQGTDAMLRYLMNCDWGGQKVRADIKVTRGGDTHETQETSDSG